MSNDQPMKIDPVTLEVIRNALPAITNEMSLDLQRTSYNMMIYEVRDYCCALLDVDGRLLGSERRRGVAFCGGSRHGHQGRHRPVRQRRLRARRCDHHQPPAGGRPAPQQRLHLHPVLLPGELIAFAVIRAHWVDVGGMSTGFGAAGVVSDPWMEGLQLDQIKLYEQGVPDEKVLKLIRDNIRFPRTPWATCGRRSPPAAWRRGAWRSCSSAMAGTSYRRASRRSSTRPRPSAARPSSRYPTVNMRPNPSSTTTASRRRSRWRSRSGLSSRAAT